MRMVSLLFVVTALLTASPGSGAPEYKESEVRNVVRDYAACVVKGNHKFASQAIMSDVDNGEIIKRYSMLISSECLGRVAGSVQLKFSDDFYRYALADALVNTEFSLAGPENFDDRLPLAHLLPPTQTDLEAKLAKAKSGKKREEIQTEFAKDTAVVWMSRFGECIVRSDPIGSRLWLLTKPDVPEETSRINALRPAFQRCLVGGTVKFSKTEMRGTVAINYYRLANATLHAPVGKSH